MGQPKDLKPARLPPRAPPRGDMYTHIHAPIVKKEKINGRDKYNLTPPKAGVITIYSDDEDERRPSSRAQDRAIKRDRSRVPPHAVEQGHQSREPHIKQESSGDRHGPQRFHGRATPAAVAPDATETQVHEPLRRHWSQARSDPPSGTSSSSASSGSDSPDSSDSSSSEDSSSEDDANASVSSVYRPTTPASSVGPSPPRTRRKKETGVQQASANLSRRSVQNDTSIGPGHTPLDFSIQIQARSLREVSELPSRSVPHISPRVIPAAAQTDRTAHPSHHRPVNSSPVVQGFRPINRGSRPPQNAPTEPRAMRTGEAWPAGGPVHSAQRPSESVSGPVSGPSSLPIRGPRLVKDKSQQKGEQRRGPARSGRIMQTTEQPPVGLLSTSSPPKNTPSSRESKAATPGPSSRRTAPPPTSPGVLVMPRAVSVRPNPVARNHESLQRVSRPPGKRTFDETEDTDSASRKAEWERMLVRVKNHEREMEKQRAQLEDTKRLLSEQKSRIDDLERRRRAEDLVRNSAMQTIEEPDVDPIPLAAHRDALPAPIPCRQAERREERERQSTCQSERRDKRKRRRSSRVARARLQEQERGRIERERLEDLELEEQLRQEQRRQAERVRCAARSVQNNAQQAHALPGPAQRMLDAVQRRIQHDVFNRPLSGNNTKIRFDDGDRPYISRATAFLMRLQQDDVLGRLRRLIEGKNFFDTKHLASTHLGCWVVSRRASCDLRLKLTDRGESHSFSFARIAARLWHDEMSIYNLIEHQTDQLKAVHTCHVDACMHPEHVVLETDRHAGERRRCKARGRCYGHKTIHKDGSRQKRKDCIFFPR